MFDFHFENKYLSPSDYAIWLWKRKCNMAALCDIIYASPSKRLTAVIVLPTYPPPPPVLYHIKGCFYLHFLWQLDVAASSLVQYTCQHEHCMTSFPCTIKLIFIISHRSHRLGASVNIYLLMFIWFPHVNQDFMCSWEPKDSEHLFTGVPWEKKYFSKIASFSFFFLCCLWALRKL